MKPPIILLLLICAATALDRIILTDNSKVYCRIIAETGTFVRIEKKRLDTTIANGDIVSLAYATADFKSQCKLIAFSQGFSAKRGKKPIQFDDKYDLQPGDTLNAGKNGRMTILFWCGMQVAVTENSRIAISEIVTETRPYKTDISVSLLEGTAFCIAQKEHIGHGKVQLHTPNAAVRIREALLMVSYNKEKNESAVAVHGGSAGVRLLGSDIGEVIVNGSERVLLSSAKNKVMQDELLSEEAGFLKSIEGYFSRRQAGEVKVPKMRKGRPLVTRWFFWAPVVAVIGGGSFGVYMLISSQSEYEDTGEEPQNTITIEGTWE